MPPDVPKSEEFFQLIKRASRYLRRHALLFGSTLVLLCVIGWLNVAVAVDLLIPLATAFRLLFAVGFWLLLIAGTVVWLVWPALRRLKLEDVALRIERVVGNMHNRLLTVLDLHRGGAKQSNPDMVAALLRQTRSKLAGFQIRQLIDRIPLVRSLAGLAAVLVWAVLLTVVFRESVPTALARILRPTADIPPVTWLRIAAPGDLATAAGDPLAIAAEITRGEVDALSLHLQQPDGQWVVYPMQRDVERHFTYTLGGLMADHRYKISGGSTWTSEYQIHVVPRPIIDAVATAIRLPRYMRHEELLPVADDARRVEAPIDSHVVFLASVSGDVARGEVVLWKRLVDRHEAVQDEEHVWFDDDLPADAETDIPWRWSTARAFTGLKSFTFGRTHQPFGFTTRLSPLDVPATGVFYLMAWLDASDPPGRLTLRVRQDNNTRVFEWGEKSPAVNGQPPVTHLGPLPETGRWVRMEVPADALGSVSSGIKLRGMSLEVDRGQASFDRPGYLIRKSGSVDTVEMEEIDARPLERDEATGRWLGEVHVATDMLLTLRFFSSLKQASADREPLEVIATQDQPPTIIMEKPAQDVVLPNVQPLPISARALDDWGIAAVGFRLGPAENTLGSVRWQEENAELATSYSINLAIDPEAEHLSPGQNLCYRLVAKDSKGQIVETKTFKLSIATPDRVNAPETAKLPESLEPLRQLLTEMLKAPGQQREAAEFAASLPPELRQSLDAEGRLQKPDGSPVEAEDARKLLEKAETQLTPEQKSRLSELIAELERRQQQLKRLAEMLKQAAQKSAASPLALQQEANLLAQFAAQANEMVGDLSPPAAAQGNAANLERELVAEKQAADHPQRLADLERQLAQVEAARQQLASDPGLAQRQLGDLAAQVESAAAARELEALATDLEARGRQLQEIAGKTAQLAQQSPQADAKQLSQISQAQSGLDRQAVPAIDRLREILGEQPAKERPAPWAPPGNPPAAPLGAEGATAAQQQAPGKADGNSAAQPNSQNQGNQADRGNRPDQNNGQGKSPDMHKSDANQNWWDKPTGAPADGSAQGQPGVSEQQPANSAGERPSGEGPDTKKANSDSAPQTPRGQLTSHQAEMKQALAQNAADARESAAAARDLADRLRQAALGNSQSGQDSSGQQPSGQDQAGNNPNGNNPNGNDQNKRELGGQPQAGQNQTGNRPKGQDQSQQSQTNQNPSGNDQGGNPQSAPHQSGQDQGGKDTHKPATDGLNSAAGETNSTAEQTPATDARQILAEPATQRALGMAQRMHADSRFAASEPQATQPGKDQSPDQKGQPGGGPSPNTAGARTGRIVAGQAPLGSDPAQRAHFYQLPPRLRGPLLEGMQERGPEGYQPMIDAYFRELNKEIK